MFESYCIYAIIDYKRLGWMRNPAALAFKLVPLSGVGADLQLLLLLEGSSFGSRPGLVVGFAGGCALVGHIFE